MPAAASEKTIIITGGNIGLGYHCAKAMATTKQWHVILACRHPNRAAQAVQQLIAETTHQQIEAMSLDLASLASVRQFATDFATRNVPPLTALVCNAGIQIVTGITYTEDGFETTFAVNHLGHFLLANLLLRHLIAPARIVFVSSATHNPAQRTGMPAPRYHGAKFLARPDIDPLAKADDKGTVGRRAYSTSKLCNVFCTYELSRRLQTEGKNSASHLIAVNAFDPGLMPGTGLARDYGAIARFAWNFVLPVVSRLVPGIKSMRESGSALARLVLDPTLEGVSGKYFAGLREIPSSQESYDTGKAAELWETSAELVKLQPDETILRCPPSASAA